VFKSVAEVTERMPEKRQDKRTVGMNRNILDTRNTAQTQSNVRFDSPELLIGGV
jgi:hypothetical protein